MNIILNGQRREVPGEVSVAELLALLNITAPRVAVEVNAQVVTQQRHATTTIRSGDCIEVVTFVGGG